MFYVMKIINVVRSCTLASDGVFGLLALGAMFSIKNCRTILNEYQVIKYITNYYDPKGNNTNKDSNQLPFQYFFQDDDFGK
jgi:hypothetical protein